MNALFESSLYFGVFISLAAYGVGVWLKKMTGWSLMNPLFVAIVLVIASISLLGISYDTYNRGAHIITYLLTPSTICLAVPLYQQIDLLKHNKRAVVAGVVSGVFSSLVIIWVLVIWVTLLLELLFLLYPVFLLLMVLEIWLEKIILPELPVCLMP